MPSAEVDSALSCDTMRTREVQFRNEKKENENAMEKMRNLFQC